MRFPTLVLRATLSICLAFTLGIAACSGDKPEPDQAVAGPGMQTPVAAAFRAKRPYEAIGEANGECVMHAAEVDTDTKLCPGVLEADWKNPNHAQKIATALDNLGNNDWKPASPAIGHTPLTGTEKSHYAVQALKGIRKSRFAEMEEGNGILVARLIVERGQPVDKRYKVSNSSTTQKKTFYLVVNYYGVDQGDVDVPGKSMKMASWTVYERTVANGRPKFDETNTGKFRYCADWHRGPPWTRGSRFATCKEPSIFLHFRDSLSLTIPQARDLTIEDLEQFVRADASAAWTAAEVSEALAQALKAKGLVLPAMVGFFPAASIQPLLGVLNADGPDDPAWLYCGAGCCVAEF